MSSLALVLGLTLGVAALLAARSRRPLGGRGALFLRAVIPSWRFFDEVAPLPRLAFRAALPGADLGAFQPLSVLEVAPGPHPLLLAPLGNLRLAYHALLEQLVADLADLEVPDGEQAERLVSYELVTQLVRTHLPAPLATTPGARFQLKVALEETLEDGTVCSRDVLISGVHTV